MEQIGRPSKRKPKPPPPLVKSMGEALAMKDPIQALWPSLVAAVFTDKDNPMLENLSPSCQALYLLDLMDREVQDGGFEQFFHNTSGQFCDETCKALEETGAKAMLSLLKMACTVFPGGIVPKDQLERRTLLCGLSADAESLLSELDDEFNAKTNSIQIETNSPENPWYLALQYMRDHANDLVASVPVTD